MKNKLLWIMLLCAPFAMRAQEVPCPPNQVQTNPANPVNNVHPFYGNYFDWTAGQYPVDWGNINFMTNPNWVSNGGAKDLYGKNDYQPEDGWELVYVDLGIDRYGNPLPQGLRSGQMWFMLYNKYRSMVRVFVAIDQLDPNNLVEIELQIPSGNYNTAIFATMDKVKKPLREFDPNIVASAVQAFTNGTVSEKHWHYADFPVNYDPCACEKLLTNGEAESKIKLKVNLLAEANIKLDGMSSGTLTMASKASASSSGSAIWSTFYGQTKKVDGAIEAGNKAYKTFELFQADAIATAVGKEKQVKMTSGINNLAKVLTREVPALKYVPYVAEALAIIDFFVGGAKKDDGTKIAPMAMQIEHSFNGTLAFNYRYINTQFFNPGSNFTPISNPAAPSLGDPRYPIYNEILGVYTLLDKPSIKVWKGASEVDMNWEKPPGLMPTFVDGTIYMRRAFKVDKESIKIAINPASDLVLKETYAQVVYEKERNSFMASANNSGTVVNDDMWVSELVPISCIDDMMFVLDIKEYLYSPGDYRNRSEWSTIDKSTSLAVTLVFENQNGDRFLYRANWEVEIEEIAYPYDPEHIEGFMLGGAVGVTEEATYNWFDKPEFTNVDVGFYQSVESIHYENEIVAQDERVQQNILIENSMVFSINTPLIPSLMTTLTAGESIIIGPQSVIKPNSRLAIWRPGFDCEVMFDLADGAYINSLCSSSKYQLSKGATKRSAEQEEKNVLDWLNVLVYPNPVDKELYFMLASELVSVPNLFFTLSDLTGRQILQETQAYNEAGRYVLTLPELATGVYVLHVTAGDKTAVEKIVVR